MIIMALIFRKLSDKLSVINKLSTKKCRSCDKRSIDGQMTFIYNTIFFKRGYIMLKIAYHKKY